ncbi:MAG TPA: hypothetical protein VIA62_22085 [Thermoanaerobaculia bacterium]|jgi:hypothetical protein|nr:hypothetical protein [Thermoanaerobaculia bacterium]
MEQTAAQTVDRLIARHGAEHAGRIRRGVAQVARRWWPEDGDEAALAAFCEANFLAGPGELAATFHRLERVLEQVDGHLHEVRRELTTPLELDTGPITTVDRLLAGLDLAAHVEEDLFRARVAFLALLNFPVHTLAERLEQGPSWDRETWARSRLMDRFAARVPAVIQQEATQTFTAADQYIAAYNLRLDRLVTGAGERPFPEGLRLISHWGLRDELASHYADASPAGLAKQRLILRVMERIVRQEIPAAVIDNPGLLWDPETNEVRPVEEAAAGREGDRDLAAREPDTRYATLLGVFRAVRKLDPYNPNEPTFIARRFERDRQIPEREVEALLVSVLAAPEVADLARLISRRLGRPLEPFDIWYSGFKSRAGLSEAELDRAVRARYPDLAAFAATLPDLLARLGFAPERARWLAERIVVDPARGAGHAVQALRREDRSHLRTRVPQGGMDYKGYNVAMHELGHNVEQVFSLNGIDRWPLASVPNNACTEAFAFLFQHRDLEMLGLQPHGVDAADAWHNETLAVLWNTYEIAGVSLVDMGVWSWLYQHPGATPAELRQATLGIARQVWNRYFAPVFGVRDSEILAIYSHMIVYGLYLPDYALGHVIAFQIARELRGRDFGAEIERIARQGRITPDLWVRGAVGRPISARALLDEAREAMAGAGKKEPVSLPALR